jgi:uncharacterized protein
MKFALFGAGGRVGRAVATEALNRGHFVTGITRSGTIPDLTHFRLLTAAGDVTDPAVVRALVGGHDAVASAVGPASGEDPGMIAAAARALIDATRKAGLKRLVVVGGAGSLTTAGGGPLMDGPGFPAGARPIALAHAEALELFRSVDDLAWTVVAPSALLESGPRTGRFRTGGDQLLVDGAGASRISISDFAIAFVDELGRGGHPHRRITVGY